MNSIPKTQENPIMKFIEGVKLLFETLAEPGDNRTPDDILAGHPDLQQPLKSENILKEKTSKKGVVDKAKVSEVKAAEALKQHKIEELIQDEEIEKE